MKICGGLRAAEMRACGRRSVKESIRGGEKCEVLRKLPCGDGCGALSALVKRTWGDVTAI